MIFLAKYEQGDQLYHFFMQNSEGMVLHCWDDSHASDKRNWNFLTASDAADLIEDLKLKAYVEVTEV